MDGGFGFVIINTERERILEFEDALEIVVY